MKKEINIVVPTDYSAISLTQYLKIQKDLDDYKDDSQAQDAFLLYNLCNITPEVARNLDNDTVEKIKEDLYTLLNKQDYDLQKFITIDGVQYGFEPNLSEMSYGAYLDISKSSSVSLDKFWSRILSILYRPVTKKKGALYEIKPYNPKDVIDEKKWLDVNMDFHFGTYFFFIHTLTDLQNAILKYLTEQASKQEMQHPHIKQTLQLSGDLINQLQSSHKKTLPSFLK
tara:strand:+ start:1683 stop:2363 length:681 start_codon:yes stop_codon:yes gene_type:complete